MPEEYLPRKVLVTGPPGCGKTTLIRRLLPHLRGPVGGMYTEEVRHKGQRIGFDIVLLDGRRLPFARVDYPKPPGVGRYGLRLEALLHEALPYLRHTLAQGGWLVLDEIGPMELMLQDFVDFVFTALEAPSPLLGTVMLRAHPIADRIKQHPRVVCLPLRPTNRDVVYGRLKRWVRHPERLP